MSVPWILDEDDLDEMADEMFLEKWRYEEDFVRIYRAQMEEEGLDEKLTIV